MFEIQVNESDVQVRIEGDCVVDIRAELLMAAHAITDIWSKGTDLSFDKSVIMIMQGLLSCNSEIEIGEDDDE